MPTAIRTGSVLFLHHADADNIGDLLCSPRHYFDFECERPTLIVGGGASNNFFCGRARRLPASVRIAWGVGQSWRFDRGASALDRLIKAARRRWTYTRASTRDPLLASDRLPLVPCVSVFHPVTEIPAGDEVGIFINRHESVSGSQAATSTLAAELPFRAFVATNAARPDAFFDSFRRAGTIITNSYHASYWGLLSGRAVHILGYSSKFTNLATLFGFPASAVLAVPRGDSAALDRAIAQCADREPLRLENADEARKDFRTRNLDFALSLAEVGVIAALKPSPSDG